MDSSQQIAGARKADRPRHERYSSQMRSSHHERGVVVLRVSEVGEGVAYQREELWELWVSWPQELTRRVSSAAQTPWPRKKARRGRILPPARTAQPPGVHLAHVAHADEADSKVFSARERRRRR